MTDSTFRRLLALYVVVVLATIGSVFIPGLYPTALEDAQALLPESWLFSNIWLAVALAVPMLVASIGGIVGLFLFKSWGRTLSFYATIASLLFYLISGASVYSGLESMLFELSALLWGGILALSYYSPIASRFDTDNSSEPKPLGGSA